MVGRVFFISSLSINRFRVRSVENERGKALLVGMKNGLPIGAGYFAVAFSLGIFAAGRDGNGLTAPEGFIASLFTIASAGEYAGFDVILKAGTYIEMALVILVANCRYLLMSCALSQRVRPDLALYHRFGMGTFITDEIFAVSIAQEGYVSPFFVYGAALTSVLPWAVGTAAGILAGSVLPRLLVSALSVAIYGMFIAIIIPPAKKNRVILGLVCVSFLLSWAFETLPVLRDISSGIRVIILTAVIAAAAAVLFPVKEEKDA